MGIGGLGIGDWGLGIGPNPQSPIPNPQSPIPNPHLKKTLIKYTNNFKNYFIKNLLFYLIIF
jgi:hypothetical protein